MCAIFPTLYSALLNSAMYQGNILDTAMTVSHIPYKATWVNLSAIPAPHRTKKSECKRTVPCWIYSVAKQKKLPQLTMQ